MNKTTRNTQFNRRDFIKITAIMGGVLAGGKFLFPLIKDDFVTVKETRLLMGTIINLAVVAETKTAGEAVVDATFAELERQVAIFNHREPDSPISVLNRTGKLSNPPKELVDVLAQALEISELTGQAFDVTVKPLLEIYQNAQPDLPTEEEIQAALKLVNYQNLQVSEDLISFPLPDMALTLDGIAKGYIVDTGTAVLKRLGYENVFVEAGGDLMASGVKEELNSWKVGVKSPRQAHEGMITSFSVTDQAVATSGDYMQYFTQDMQSHHILDPRTGYSAPHLASATVVASSCAQADALATALMVMKPDDGLALVDTIDNMNALLIGKNLEEYRSKGFKDR